MTMIHAQADEDSPCKRRSGDAMVGDGALFTREDAVDAAWTVVGPVLAPHPRAVPYRRGGWHNPMPEPARA
ncbi:MAG: hypothetical protein M0P72_04080 [Metallibacterium scheffleri]|jgi:glucose-6-phosphate 1-dehydrogenase|uniref:hypothetical protein n=1 Tax=Metallibacterium scheffleri TaxID=993689 RepID=UPI0026ED2419|nr:hypothetical protein [Metallibacterium scheffleri]MCK9366315.1 hypothetical protein [Metallibacterium scheffleri]HVC15946.1 hypothetical protein [Rhodanobacter sp.]